MKRTPVVGVLALQGDFAEHAALLRSLDAAPREVRTAAQLAGADALIIPGGESTTMATLMDIFDLRGPITDFARSGRPLWGTCAGMILLADRLVEPAPEPLRLMDILVHRNAFGRQVDSFETDIDFAGIDGGPLHAVFIRAPWVAEVGPQVEVLAALDNGAVVAVRQANLLATAFHPELTPDPRAHAYFLEMARVAAA
ncbi:MAG: pyridoxal 5'-phosphate synthase glutaminase subunit PdxT [Chloroflexota bacterium]|nr:pyridoxal 5'-phosphate synthase glutaminase subunit PdxT [Chloroflexota bacterium]